MPAMIKPELNMMSLLEMQCFFTYKTMLTASRMAAILHKGIAIFVRKARGMPTMVIPITLSAAMIPRQTLWQTCHEPRTLAAPDTLPEALIIFSFIWSHFSLLLL